MWEGLLELSRKKKENVEEEDKESSKEETEQLEKKEGHSSRSMATCKKDRGITRMNGEQHEEEDEQEISKI